MTDVPEAIHVEPSFSSFSPIKEEIVDELPPADASDDRNTSLGSAGRLLLPSLTPSTHPVPPAKRQHYRVAENRWVTRDIAALDFLLNIPLQAESAVVQNGYLQQTKQQEEYETSSGESENESERRRRLVARTPKGKQQHTHHHHDRQVYTASGTPGDPQGKWWEKWISGMTIGGGRNNNKINSASHHNNSSLDDAAFLEGPTRQDKLQPASSNMLASYTPGRRLEGDDAIRIQIPLTAGQTTLTKQRSIARIAALREWERQTAHGVTRTVVVPVSATASNNNKTSGSSIALSTRSTPATMATTIKATTTREYQPPLLDGRLFFSASGSYPVSVLSMIRYEPKREEAQLRRQKLEARGGGGSTFSIPSRGDWRGISYRSLLPRREHKDNDKQHRKFNRFVEDASGVDNEYDDGDDDDDDTSLSSEDSNEYVPGILDDPDMVLGRHRNVMVGDRVIGPIIASTIQFVEPALLKADLNKQFRERFDGWEPSKSALKYIGAKVINGNYVLTDPVLDEEDEEKEALPSQPAKTRKRQSSTTSSVSSEPTANDNHTEKQATEKQIRMPPSLTLSKIRSLKHQALQVAVKANFEIGTLSLACVYFERLCLDCRVDKSNRRLTFAACLLLASKLNEPNVSRVMQKPSGTSDGGDGKISRFTSFVRPNNRCNTMFASLLEFFTQEWEIGLKQLFDAEWGVFAALGFNLHAQPSQVAFHFKRFMKTIEWSPKNYLGAEMYGYWQESLEQEEDRRRAMERRKARLKHRKEEELLNLHIEIENDFMRRQNKNESDQSSALDEHHENERNTSKPQADGDPLSPSHHKVARKSSGINFFQRFGMRRIMSAETLFNPQLNEYNHTNSLPLYETPAAAAAAAAANEAETTSNTKPNKVGQQYTASQNQYITFLPSAASAVPSQHHPHHHHHHHGLAGLSDSAEAAMYRPPFDEESGLLMETFSVDSVAGSDKDKDFSENKS